MSKIDFSKAPEGATHYCDVTYFDWWKLVDGEWFFIRGDSKEWVKSNIKQHGKLLKTIPTVERPTC